MLHFSSLSTHKKSLKRFSTSLSSSVMDVERITKMFVHLWPSPTEPAPLSKPRVSPERRFQTDGPSGSG
jgi:hypothetical protein